MAVERASGGTSLIDVLDRVLDKGIVVDDRARVSLVGIDLVTAESRVVVASVETCLTYVLGTAAEAACAPTYVLGTAAEAACAPTYGMGTAAEAACAPTYAVSRRSAAQDELGSAALSATTQIASADARRTARSAAKKTEPRRRSAAVRP